MIKEQLFYFMIGLNIALLYLFLNYRVEVLKREKIKDSCLNEFISNQK